MPQQTKIFRVFVSSTFNDMKTERNLLREQVFPVLEQFCREKGARFQAIDLRWGVSEESQRDQKTMAICLNEIKRCQQITPRPNFLILLGNRYGWQPLPPVIPATEMAAIRSHLDAATRAVVNDWYRLDENAIPAEYVLQPRGVEFSEYQDWQPVETQLRRALREAVLQANFPQDALVKYTASATHQEILAGALNPPPDAAAPESHVLAMSRSIRNLSGAEVIEEYLDHTDGKPDPYSQEQLSKLRQELQKRLPEDHLISYTAVLENRCIILEDEETITDRIIAHFKSLIEAELAQLVDEDEIRQEMRYHEAFAEKLTLFFTGREEALEHIRSYLDDQSAQKPLSLIGASGSGKTCVMAKAIMQAGERNAVLVYRFIGANAKSSNILSLLTSICGQITRAHGTELKNLLEDYQKGRQLDINVLTILLQKCLALAGPDRSLIIFLDALDQLSDVDGANTLQWLPRVLPPHAHIVVSCLPALEEKLQDTEKYLLPPMPAADGEKLLGRWLAVENRTLTHGQKQEVLTRFAANGLPLFLRIVFEQARTWHSYETPESLPDDVPGITERFLVSLEKAHSPLLVSQTVGYILSGRNKGLTEDEILDMLVFNKEDPAGYWQHFLKNSHPAHREEVEKAGKLPMVIWSRLFMDLMPYLTERDSYGERLIGFYHRQFNEILKQSYLPDEKAVHVRLGHYFSQCPHFFDGDNQKKPNIRKCVEQPWQQTRAEMWDEVTETLCDLEFIQAKCAAKLTFDLVYDCNAALQAIPDNAENIRKENERQVRMEKYTLDLIDCAKGKISTDNLAIPESVRPGTDKEIEEKIKSIKSDPSRANRLRDFLNFLGKEADNLQNFSSEFPHFAVQQAWNSAAQGPVGKAAEHQKKTDLSNLLLKKTGTRPEWTVLPAVLKQLKGHTNWVRAVSVTPDGRRAVSGSEDKTLIVWDLETGMPLRRLKGHTDVVWAVSVTPDGRRAVSGSRDHTLILWDLETGMPLRTLKGHVDYVFTVCINPDGKRAVSGSSDNTLIVWDLETGKPIRTLKGHTEGVLAVSVTPDCKLAVSSGYKTLIIWDFETGMPLRTLKGHTDSVRAVSVTPECRRAVSGSDDHTLIVWDLETGMPLRTLKRHTDEVYAVSVTPDCRLAVSGSRDNTLIVWDLETGMLIRTLKGHTDSVRAVRVTPYGRRAVSGSWDKTLIVWDLETGMPIRTLKGHTGSVYTVSVTPDGRRAVSGSRDHTLIVWDLETGMPVHTLKGHTKLVDAVSVTPDGRRAVSGAGDHTLIVWDLETGKPIRTLKGHTEGVLAVSVTPDCKLAVSSGYKTLIIWDFETGMPLRTLKGHTDSVRAVSVTPECRRAVSGSDDHTLIVWDLETGMPLRTLKRHTDEVYAVSVTPDCRLAVSGSRDNTLIVWDLETGMLIRTLKGHTDSVRAVRVTPYGRRAVSGSWDKTLIVWDLETGMPVHTLKGHKYDVSAVSVSPDGRRAVSGSSDNTLIVWDLETGMPLRTLKGHTNVVGAVSVTPDCRLAVSGSHDHTLIVWDLETARKIGCFAAAASIFSLAVAHKVVFGGESRGETFFLQAGRELLCPGLGIVTVRFIWEYEKNLFSGPSADCPFCGTRFEPPKAILDTIHGILGNGNIGPKDSPCLKLPKEAWDEPKLLSTCPKCKEALRFNPFIVDPEGMSL